MENMKKEYIKPTVVFEAIELEDSMMIVSGYGDMNARGGSFSSDGFYEEEEEM